MCLKSFLVDGVEEKEEDKLEEAASRLTQLADEIPFAPPELEEDSEQGETSSPDTLIPGPVFFSPH